MYRLFILLWLFFASEAVQAKQVTTRLYINSGSFTTVNGQLFPYLAFNGVPIFSPKNKVINLTTADTLNLIIINQDTVLHHFAVKGKMVGIPINKSDSVQQSLHFSKEGIYLFFDDLNYPSNRYLGLGGMICVSNNTNAKSFFWNIKEHQRSYNYQLIKGQSVSWQDYYPDYFTINGLSHPDLQNDTTAVITGKTGDTIRIYVANTGQSTHSIHFHGFHCNVIYSTSARIQINCSKDTFPLESMEALVLEMIPDKIGKYSVHDHNLVAVSGGNTHPNGMLLIMNIQ